MSTSISSAERSDPSARNSLTRSPRSTPRLTSWSRAETAPTQKIEVKPAGYVTCPFRFRGLREYASAVGSCANGVRRDLQTPLAVPAVPVSRLRRCMTILKLTDRIEPPYASASESLGIFGFLSNDCQRHVVVVFSRNRFESPNPESNVDELTDIKNERRLSECFLIRILYVI